MTDYDLPWPSCFFQNISIMVVRPELSGFKKTDGSQRIVIYMYADGEKCIIPTEYYVLPNHWVEGLVDKKRGNADYINANIRALVSSIEGLWLKNPDCSAREIKRMHLMPDPGPAVVESIAEFIERRAQGMEVGKVLNKGKPFSAATIGVMRWDTKALLKYAGNKGWNEINEGFYNSYSTYLRSELKLQENTIAKKIKTLKKIMRAALKEGLHSNTSFMDFHASYVDTDTIYLTEDEMEMFMSCELPQHLERERERFYVSYNLFLRFGDSVVIDGRDIFFKGDKAFLTLMTAKTKNKPVIPLFPKTLEILKKYNYSMQRTTNQESNWKLKEIGKTAKINSIFTASFIKGGKIEKQSGPKYEFITTHTARRSMATNYYLSMKKHGSIDLKSLQLMGGWKSLTVLEKYLKIGALENALDASTHPFFN